MSSGEIARMIVVCILGALAVFVCILAVTFGTVFIISKLFGTAPQDCLIEIHQSRTVNQVIGTLEKCGQLIVCKSGEVTK